MAYNGYLLKVGNYVIDPKKYIAAESYQVTRNVQDLDSYRDANGVLHRNALAHAPIKVEFTTPAMMTNREVAEFMGNIRSQTTNEIERKYTVEVYVPELDDYVTDDMYMPDPQFTIYGSYDNHLTYKATRIAFIGY